MYTVAYGASLRGGVTSARIPANASLTALVGTNRYPKTIEIYYAGFEKSSGHHCDNEMQADPDD